MGDRQHFPLASWKDDSIRCFKTSPIRPSGLIIGHKNLNLFFSEGFALFHLSVTSAKMIRWSSTNKMLNRYKMQQNDQKKRLGKVLKFTTKK
jgi:hypothetical protein